ncbi:MAG TPA: GNAT family N-acetyltransferase [Lachnospiraceae bacterium]|nr:GNAT family N-acetyltransferase [Lachnospiraceae bacterium]
MKEIIVYEMQYIGKGILSTDVKLIPFQENYYSEYERIYNECFYSMRKELDVEPYNFYSDFDQLKDKMKDIFLLLQDQIIVGSVACYGNEIDDLVVNKKYQNKGIGQKLLLWAINHIRVYSDNAIIIHVAKWNEKALSIYKSNDFIITKTEKVR